MNFEEFSDRADVLRLIDMLRVDHLAMNRLRGLGVTLGALAAQSVAVGSMNVCFDEQAEVFVPDEAGVPAIVVVPPADDPLTDVVAFDPAVPARYASFTGRTFALGDHLIDNPATYFLGRALPIYRTPLEWLRAECRGICVVDRRPSAIRARLLPVPRVIVGDLAQGRELRALFCRTQQRPKIIIPLHSGAVA